MTSILILILCGCGGSPSEVAADAPPQVDLSTRPLTVAIWKQSQEHEKYSHETLARLRAEDPTVRPADKWKAFYKETVLPGFQRDVAGLSEVSPASNPK